MKINNIEISWLGHSGFRIKDLIHDRVIYIDPYQISGGESADIILVTHSHHDHLSIEDLKRISTPSTVILAPADCQSKFQGKFDFRDSRIMNPGAKVTMGNIHVEAIPAYNTDKQFHPKGNEWVGYIIDMNSKRIYHAGDSDAIPEMNKLHKIDVALVPVSGTYVMTADEAAKAVNAFEPKLAIPMHYGAIVGKESDAQRFKELCKCDVMVLEKEN
ncbi:TPA: MBL fold metallo-hydrolase [Candidatus Woesearchaeota archaeon]|nr:MBL fold metallo-hydrolase [Candidatus Woesearchaeota archaeon]